ncbi:WG repeat-containing protein [Hymenobacter oligotrophus]|uniref:WG repeat-containing protein n=1 Tax=Hymenobacter oligotrophus TaxID=2319843 RepID=A0A3B7RP12_9BACT|nr:WG repeat-containing protein [Hymenobacter oligotrophus]AYA35967.1 WG repeat-containing protein [Hymenobacter oligotrophus]
MRSVLLFLMLLVSFCATSQAIHNLSFEPEANRRQPLLMWAHRGSQAIRLSIDTTQARQGRGSLLIDATRASAPVRLAFVQGQRWGYLDANGKVAIAPRFVRAQPFSEGLAAVRQHGRYGYIDAQGAFAIAAAYDYAEPFRHGYATVWRNGTPLLINPTGQVQFQGAYQSWETHFGEAGPDYLIATTRTGRQGVLSPQGRLLIDTVYSAISAFSHERAIVTEWLLPNVPDEKYRSAGRGVIDWQGRLVVPFGRYHQIEPFQEGLAKVDIPASSPTATDDDGFINPAGELVLRLPATQMRVAHEASGFGSGVVAVETYRGQSYRRQQRTKQVGLMDVRGQLLFSSKDLIRLAPYPANQTIAQTSKGQWQVLDKRGRLLNTAVIEEIYFERNHSSDDVFAGGWALVRTAAGIGAIDTSGRFVLGPREFPFSFDDAFRLGNRLYFSVNVSQAENQYDYRIGYWDLKTNALVSPRFQQIGEPAGTGTELRLAVLDNRLAYIDAAGTVVWQQPPGDTLAQVALNLDYMRRATYGAASPAELERYGGVGGHAKSTNKPQPIGELSFRAGALSFTVPPQPSSPATGARAAAVMQLANTTADTVFFSAQDGLLYLTVQALNPAGQWQDIEYVPGSSCGNSDHTVYLPASHYWQFAAPAFEGEFQTKLRAKVLVKRSRNPDDFEQVVLYSNEFMGGVNPGQFWRKLEYVSSGIMDPYRE